MAEERRIALVDSDILVYRVGWTTEDTDEAIARWRLAELIERIVDGIQAVNHFHFITSDDKSNFRYKLYAEYKANRTKPKPKHYAYLRHVLVDEYDAKIVEGQEADDALGIAMTEMEGGVLCTIDKDLNQVPGWHYDFVKERLFKIGELEASRCFYEQVLVGDKSVDNIEGCPRVGPVNANRILEGCENENEMLMGVVQAYQKAYRNGDEWADRLLLAGSLLWIRKAKDQPWLFEGAPVSKETLLAFSKREE